MSCDIVAKVGKAIKIETQELITEDVSVDPKHLVSNTLQYTGIISADCKAELEEAILTIKNNDIAKSNDFSVYLFNENPGTFAANDFPDLTVYYQYLLGVIHFNKSTLLNNSVGEIRKYRGVFKNEMQGNLILHTAATSGVIYALVFNEGTTNLNFIDDTVKLTLKIWRY